MNEKSEKGEPGLAVRVLPGLASLRHYEKAWLRQDLFAGLSVGVVLIPAVIAYAGLMGIPPQHGLYAALVPLLIYPLLGTSRQMIVGPDIAISLLVASAIEPLAGGNPTRAAELSAALALMTGGLLIIGARFRIGAVADFLSKPVLVGYMTGAALILVASQLDKIFGLKLHSQDFFPRLGQLGAQLGQTHLPTLLFACLLFAVLLGLHWWFPKMPKAVVVFVVALPASILFDLEKKGLAVVGQFPHGLPLPAMPIHSWREVHSLLPAAMGIALLTYTEGILLARAFAARHGYEVQANRELDALGYSDVLTGLFQGFAVTGSQSRTVLNDNAGARSQVASVVAAVTLAIFLLWLTPLIAKLPLAALACILVYSGFTLVEFGTIRRMARFHPGASVLAALTTLGVLAVGVVPGILVGVALSLLALLREVSHPPDAVLKRLPNGRHFHDLGEVPRADSESLPGLLVYRFYAPLLFCNSAYFKDRILRLIAETREPVKHLLVDAQAITALDVTAAEMLHGLSVDLRKRGISLRFAHANRPFLQVLERAGLKKEIGAASFFGSVHECVDSLYGPGAEQRPPQAE